MRIVFNFAYTGMANNGGTRTLVRCAETLARLGHDVTMFCGNSRYTWHKPKGLSFSWPHHPVSDVTVGSGYGSWKSVARYKAGKQAVYMRGLETWSAAEHEIVGYLKKIPNVFVNSEWLLEYAKGKGVSAILQYPGLDWEWFTDMGGPREGVCAMMHNKHPKKRSVDCQEVEAMLGFPWQYLNRHIKRPDSPTLNKWYNRFKIWFAPNELEGLHNCPMEAALSGCALVCTDAHRSGMTDYAVHEETALVYPARDLVVASEHVQRLLDDEDLRLKLNRNMVELLREKMGTREERMTEFAARLENAHG